MMLAFLLAAAVTVGDPVTIDLPKGTVVQPSPDYEIVSRSGSRLTVRTFQPKSFTVKGTSGGRPFAQTVDVRSVLTPGDDLVPAPLVPPRGGNEPWLPWILVALAALSAIAAWIRLLPRRPKVVEVIEPPLTPEQRFEAAVRAAAASSQPWARLADALRDYLSAVADLPLDLTTTQLLARTENSTIEYSTITEVLREGDLEKFSPWGVRRTDFDDVARKALEIAA
jgi:hypothetical protein